MARGPLYKFFLSTKCTTLGYRHSCQSLPIWTSATFPWWSCSWRLSRNFNWFRITCKFVYLFIYASIHLLDLNSHLSQVCDSGLPTIIKNNSDNKIINNCNKHTTIFKLQLKAQLNTNIITVRRWMQPHLVQTLKRFTFAIRPPGIDDTALSSYLS